MLANAVIGGQTSLIDFINQYVAIFDLTNTSYGASFSLTGSEISLPGSRQGLKSVGQKAGRIRKFLPERRLTLAPEPLHDQMEAARP